MTNNEILFCGDVHGRLRRVLAAAARLRPTAVVLLGDIEAPGPLHVELERPVSGTAPPPSPANLVPSGSVS